MTVNKESTVTVDSPVLVLIGPTAIGKTALSFELADKFGCEIISVDSMQVYRYMNIGTAKPSVKEMKRVAHHLIDIVDPDQQFDAAQFVKFALSAIGKIIEKGKIPLLTGGTGMYLRALLQGLFDFETVIDKSVRADLAERLEREGHLKLYALLQDIDPETASRIHPNDTQRLLRALEIYYMTGKPWSKHLEMQPTPPVKFNKLLQVGLSCDRQLLHERIEKRSVQMMQDGLIQEVEGLRKMGYNSTLASMQSIGYRHANNYIDGIWNMDETMKLLFRDTRRYAKRQLTWFGSNTEIIWFDRNAAGDVVRTTDTWLND